MQIILGIFVISCFGVFGMFMAGRGSNTNYNNLKKTNSEGYSGIIARVDGRKIKQDLFKDYMFRIRQLLAMRYGSDNIFEGASFIMLKEQTLEGLINQEIFLQEAGKRRIRVMGAEVAMRLKEYRDGLLGGSLKLEDPSIQGRLKYFFADNDRNKDFREILVRIGISHTIFKRGIQRMIMEAKVKKEIGDGFLGTEDNNARQKATEILRKLRLGEDFAILARQFSEDETTKEEAGDMGWQKHGGLPPEIEKLAFVFDRGQISDLIKTSMGYHIIQVVDKKEAIGAEFETERPKIVQQIAKRKSVPPAQITPEEIRSEYEEVSLRQILIKVRPSESLAYEWLKTELPKHKIEVMDPELNAYRYYARIDVPKGEKKTNYKKALTLYKEASEAYPSNPYIYYQIGTIFETLDKKENPEEPEDPYQSQVGKTKKDEKKKTKVKNRKYLKQAIFAYEEAIERGRAVGNYDSLFYLSIAKIYEKMGKKKEALKKYSEAFDYANDKTYYLEDIKEGLKNIGAVKKAKEVQKFIDEITVTDEKDKNKEETEETAKSENESEEGKATETTSFATEPTTVDKVIEVKNKEATGLKTLTTSSEKTKTSMPATETKNKKASGLKTLTTPDKKDVKSQPVAKPPIKPIVPPDVVSPAIVPPATVPSATGTQ